MFCYSKILVLLNTRSLVANDFSTKSGKVMGKIMGMNKNKKKFYPNKGPLMPTTSFFDRVPLENKITGNPRRSSILNKLFMRNITDLMSTGEYAAQLYGYGIQINKVKITPDFKILKVYWIANETCNDDIIEDLLKKSAHSLKHELSQLRVMGHVPNIVFMKDKGYFNAIKVEQKLAIADYGDDYIKSDIVEELKSEHQLWTVLDADFKKKIEEFDSSSMENNINGADLLPVMPQNALGLNHMDILNRIKKSKSKSEAGHRNPMKDDSIDDDNYDIKSHSGEYTSHVEHREAFMKFLHSRQILKQKQRKLEKNWSPDKQYLQEEYMEQYSKQKDLYEDTNNEDDYVEEIDDEPYRK